MRIIENPANGELQFLPDSNDNIEQQQFLARMTAFTFERHGASVFIYQKTNHLLLGCFNTFDNTFFVCSPDGYKLAAEFGTKRFPVGDARLALDEKQATTVGAIKFARDLSCPITSASDEKIGPYKPASLTEILQIKKSNQAQFYQEMADLFGRCADFTPGKKEEYMSGEKIADKYCRLNLTNEQSKDGIITDHVFLLDEKNNNQIVGTVSATICFSKTGTVDVYFYDEIVDYFTKIKNPEDIQQLRALNTDTSLDENRRKEIIADIVNPKRMELMKSLFTAARQKIAATIQTLDPQLQLSKVRGFIRAADGRVPLYVSELHCSPDNTQHFVIHGRPTDYAKMLDAHIKLWANKRLAVLAPVQKAAASSNTFLAAPPTGQGQVATATTGAFPMLTMNK